MEQANSRWFYAGCVVVALFGIAIGLAEPDALAPFCLGAWFALLMGWRASHVSDFPRGGLQEKPMHVKHERGGEARGRLREAWRT